MITALPAPLIIAGILGVFLIAGMIKGALGIGFPAFAMSMFPMFIDPSLGVALLAVPILLTNFTQFVTVKGWPSIVRRFLPCGAVLIITIFVVSQLATNVDDRWINMLVGLSLSAFAISALCNIRIPVNEGARWQVVVGVLSGILGGVSAVKSPVMVYAVALKLPREEFIAAAGFLFFTGGVGLVSGLATASVMTTATLILSGAAVVLSLLGFRIGAWIRPKLSERVFRLALLWIILVLGVRLVIVNLL